MTWINLGLHKGREFTGEYFINLDRIEYLEIQYKVDDLKNSDVKFHFFGAETHHSTSWISAASGERLLSSVRDGDGQSARLKDGDA